MRRSQTLIEKGCAGGEMPQTRSKGKHRDGHSSSKSKLKVGDFLNGTVVTLAD
jgi:hypothetical protein